MRPTDRSQDTPDDDFRHAAIVRFFTGLAEHTFHTRLGVVDPPVVDYISNLLIRFVRQDAMFTVRDRKGRPLNQVTDMMLEAQHRVGVARRDVHRHIGDFTLFWSGLYPESLEHRQAPQKPDHLIDYRHQGKRAYLIASQIEADERDRLPSELLHRLSNCFELCMYGLREIRSEWERSDDDDAPQPIFF